MKSIFSSILFLFSSLVFSQDSLSVLSLSEYLGYVKSFHPIVKQANLIVNESEAKLMKSRGAFDPKLEVDYSRKKFKGTEYYDKLNSTFKIPTWYGIELKGNFENNTGDYLNPENTVPVDGLYSAGVSVSLARGFLANERMTVLKQSKLYTKQALADRRLLVNNILFEATKTYFNWLQAYNEKQVYEEFLENAQMRFNGVKKSYAVGEMPAIDTVEARISLNNRKLGLEKSNIKYIKSTLELSNFLWLSNDIPVELEASVTPATNAMEIIDDVLNTSQLDLESYDYESHPKLQSLDYKQQSLTLERRLKRSNLLPVVDLQYNFLSQTPEEWNTFSTDNYKSGLSIVFPLFLRKERGDLKLANIKLQDIKFEILNTSLSLKNKVNGLSQEIDSYKKQNEYTLTIVSDYSEMLRAEERKYFLGESSLFLVNSRESYLIDAKLKAIQIENDYLTTKASLFNVLAISDVSEY
ncbi:TolC family protein [Flavobacteriaceae bacterium XHP0103]|uniref:TolC family protein n=1 Tax=Marixanthotalea marina TaxID=2844359 RepID=UPI002989C7A1|nr:TolC family protein [Marixanthotalea marina]MBU3821762.1 TolC family protein [Marixanthotalea marina]